MNFIYIVYYQASTEQRNVLCNTGDKFIHTIINIKECEEKHKLLLLFLRIYHPNGAKSLEHVDNYNRERWKSNLQKIYQFVRNCLNPSASKSDVCYYRLNKDYHISKFFLELALEGITRLLFNCLCKICNRCFFHPSFSPHHGGPIVDGNGSWNDWFQWASTIEKNSFGRNQDLDGYNRSVLLQEKLNPNSDRDSSFDQVSAESHDSRIWQVLGRRYDILCQLLQRWPWHSQLVQNWNNSGQLWEGEHQAMSESQEELGNDFRHCNKVCECHLPLITFSC